MKEEKPRTQNHIFSPKKEPKGAPVSNKGMIKVNNHDQIEADPQPVDSRQCGDDGDADIATAAAAAGGDDDDDDDGKRRTEESGRERLKRHRGEVAGQVWIPDIWGQEDLLKEWIDYSMFDAAMVGKGILSARSALVEEGRIEGQDSMCKIVVDC